MHTIDGVPACYWPGMQICYANHTRGNDGIISLAESIGQIKKEQKLTLTWRKAQGFVEEVRKDYGYCRLLRKLVK